MYKTTHTPLILQNIVSDMKTSVIFNCDLIGVIERKETFFT